MKNTNKQKKSIFIVGLVLILACGVGYFIWDNQKSKADEVIVLNQNYRSAKNILETAVKDTADILKRNSTMRPKKIFLDHNKLYY